MGGEILAIHKLESEDTPSPSGLQSSVVIRTTPVAFWPFRLLVLPLIREGRIIVKPQAVSACSDPPCDNRELGLTAFCFLGTESDICAAEPH